MELKNRGYKYFAVREYNDGGPGDHGWFVCLVKARNEAAARKITIQRGLMDKRYLVGGPFSFREMSCKEIMKKQKDFVVMSKALMRNSVILEKIV